MRFEQTLADRQKVLLDVRSAGQRLPAGLRQEQQRDEAETVAGGRQRERVTQPDVRRRDADRGRPERADPPADVVAEPLARAAQLGRVQFGEVDGETAEDARTEEPEG